MDVGVTDGYWKQAVCNSTYLGPETIRSAGEAVYWWHAKDSEDCLWGGVSSRQRQYDQFVYCVWSLTDWRWRSWRWPCAACRLCVAERRHQNCQHDRWSMSKQQYVSICIYLWDWSKVKSFTNLCHVWLTSTSPAGGIFTAKILSAGHFPLKLVYIFNLLWTKKRGSPIPRQLRFVAILWQVCSRHCRNLLCWHDVKWRRRR